MAIPPTLSPIEAEDQLWDAVVIGAGPAGAIAAREMAKLGDSVLLVDKAHFPRFKVCGGCLSAASLAHLQAVGLGHLPASIGGQPFRQLQWHAGRRHARIDLPMGWSVSRTSFDAALAQAAIDAGVQFLPGVIARILGGDATSRKIELLGPCGNRSVAGRVVLAASGLSGAATSEFPPSQLDRGSLLGAGVTLHGRDEFYRPGMIYMASGSGGYVGLVRVEQNLLNVAAALSPRLVRTTGSLAGAAASILNGAGLPSVEWGEQTWKGTPLLTRRSKCMAGRRLLLVGDAGGYVEPFTGEGMAWAMSAARAAAPLARQGGREWTDQIVRQWQSIHRRTVSRRQRVCRMTARLLRSPRLTYMVVGLLHLCPRVATPFVKAAHRRRPDQFAVGVPFPASTGNQGPIR